MDHDREDDLKNEDVPHDNAKSRERGEENRREMDEIPAHGTDPLHEGP